MFGASQIDPRRVAVYIRWSTEEQGNGTTLEVQREACEHFLKSQGWEFRPELVFVDDGYSGGNLNRPALGRLRSAVHSGLLCGVVVYKLDRLSRNLMDCINLVRQEWAKIALFSTMEHFDTHSALGQMVFNILVSFAEFERNVIRDRTMSGKRKRREQGRNSGFKYPYGYRKSEAGGFEIDPGPADSVRRMFADYLSGSGITTIADRLNAEGMPAPGGGVWRACTVRLMLQNPFYAGDYAYGYYAKEDGKQKRAGAPRHVMEGAVPALIARADFERVQKVRSSRQRWGEQPPRSSDYILSKILRCARCGGPMIGQGNTVARRYYRCANAKDLGTCDCGSLPKGEVEERVMAEVRQAFASVNLDRYLERVEGFRAQAVQTRQRVVEELTARVADLQRRQDKLETDYFTGELDARQYTRMSAKLAEDAEGVAGQLAAARAALAEAQTAGADLAHLTALARQVDGLTELSPDQVRHLLRELLASLTAYRPKTKGRYNTTPIELTIEHRVTFVTPA